MFRRFSDLIDPFASYTPGTPPRGVRDFILTRIRPLRPVIALSLAASALSAALEVWLIFYAGRLVDTLAATPPRNLWPELGTELLAVAALVLLVRPLVWLGREGLDDLAIRPNAATMIRWRAHRHVRGQSVGWFGSDMSGRIAARVQEVGDTATTAAYVVVHTLSFVAFYIVGSLWFLTSVDIRLAIPMVAWTAIYAGLAAFVVPRFSRAARNYQAERSALSGRLVDTYANIDTIKLFADQRALDRSDRERFAATRAAYVAQQRLEVTVNGGMAALESFLLVGLVGWAIVLWHGGDAPLGLIAAALALAFRINGMAEWLLDAVASLVGAVGATRDALTTVAQPHDIVDAPDASELDVSGGSIRLTGVSHHYGGGDGGLDGVDLQISPGEKVGLVGHSGAGKSTLVNLILRFHDAETGRIEIDGQDIRAVTQEGLRRTVAVVTQDGTLLHRSVQDNIAGSTTALSEVRDAARRAEADGFIRALRDSAGRTGYAAHVGERGVILSGGQRQRIAIARAIFKDAPILVLDEATSALDSHVESAILDTLYRAMEGRTVIAIAHRLSTIARMGRIVVLDHGRIVEEGPHERLLAAGGIYAELWAHQSGGFLGT